MVERSLPGNPEKRKHRRAALSIRIPYFEVVHYEKDGAWGEGVSHDISAGGIFIETPTPHPPGVELFMRFMLPNTKAPIEVVGRVVYTVEQDPRIYDPRPPGMGIQFTRFEKNSQAALNEFLIENLPKGQLATEDT